ncbi:MAG TPA: phage portal protein [Nakamurella sp.]
MGLGSIFLRDIKIEQTDTVTGDHITDVIVTGPGGSYPSWSSSGPYRGALQIAAAWRASMLLADLLGRLPWDEYVTRPGADPDAPPEKLPTPTILDRPSPPDTRVVTFSSWGLDALFHGNAVGVYADRDRSGYPTAITPVEADRCWIKRVERADGLPYPVGSPAYWIGDEPNPSRAPNIPGRWYSPDDVFHVKGPCRPGALRGMGVLEAGLADSGALGLASMQNQQAANVSSAGVPTMHIRSFDPDFDGGQATELKAKAIETQRVRSPMVTNALVEVKPLSWNPTETQLLDARRLSLVDIANLFGMDAEWVNAGQVSGTYQNVESKGIDFLRHSAGGWLARFEQALSLLRPRGHWVEANRNAELQADTLQRYQVYEIAIRNGVLTRDECRALERRPKLTPKQREEALPASEAHEPAGPPGSNDLPGGVPGAGGAPSGPQGARNPGKPGRQGPTHGPASRTVAHRGHDSAGERIGDRWQ